MSVPKPGRASANAGRLKKAIAEANKAKYAACVINARKGKHNADSKAAAGDQTDGNGQLTEGQSGHLAQKP